MKYQVSTKTQTYEVTAGGIMQALTKFMYQFPDVEPIKVEKL